MIVMKKNNMQEAVELFEKIAENKEDYQKFHEQFGKKFDWDRFALESPERIR
jgi:hypothetical protein